MTTVWSGLSVGAVYVLVAVGYNLVFTAAGVFNFAQAQLVMLATFLSYWGLTTLGLISPLVILISAAIVMLVGVAEQLVAIRPLRSGVNGELLTTVGVATIVQGGVVLIWGVDPLQVPFLSNHASLSVLGGRVFPVELLLAGLAVVVAVGLHIVKRRSIIGLASLATTEDREAAMLRGINVQRLSTGSFAMAGALAGILGPIVGANTFAVSSLGTALALKGFVALAIGGFGSELGALIGGLSVGLIEANTTRWVGDQYTNLAVLGVLLIVLMVRPQGLFGTRRERLV